MLRLPDHDVARPRRSVPPRKEPSCAIAVLAADGPAPPPRRLALRRPQARFRPGTLALAATAAELDPLSHVHGDEARPARRRRRCLRERRPEYGQYPPLGRHAGWPASPGVRPGLRVLGRLRGDDALTFGVGGHEKAWFCDQCGEIVGDECHFNAPLKTVRAFLGEEGAA